MNCGHHCVYFYNNKFDQRRDRTNDKYVNAGRLLQESRTERVGCFLSKVYWVCLLRQWKLLSVPDVIVSVHTSQGQGLRMVEKGLSMCYVHANHSHWGLWMTSRGGQRRGCRVGALCGHPAMLITLTVRHGRTSKRHDSDINNHSAPTRNVYMWIAVDGTNIDSTSVKQ